ncbi:uncharacterized protein LOC135838180 [Planococcus citri]|uniref:uncharacterized protein LOC135838180 n=1 Tax=Planococcus citri TaxID=170843 RepID=UPI0031F99709
MTLEVRELLEESSIKSTTPLKRLYNAKCSRVRSDVSSYTPYKKVVKGLQKRRSKAYPPRPDTLIELGEMLNNDEQILGKTIDGENFYLDAQENVLLLLSPETKQNWKLAADACVISDFESGSYAAFHALFPAARMQGCWFHFSQAIEKRVKTLGLTGLAKENAEVRRTIKMLMAIALLPENEIAQAYDMVRTHAYITNLLGIPKLVELLDYVEAYWLNGKVF